MLHKTLSLPAQRLRALAATYGTPLYVYHESVIRIRCRELTGAFSDLPVSWLYAMKANDNPHLLSIIMQEGFGFDTVSPEEMELGLAVGAPAEKIFYTENNMSDEEMRQALARGVLLNLGSFTRFEAFCAQKDVEKCCVRLKPDIGDGHHARVNTGDKESKFGIQTDLIPDLISLAAKTGKKITGLHMHIGSGIKKPENLHAAMKVLLTHASAFPDLEFINFGGGFPTPYKLNENRFDIQNFSRIIGKLLKEDLKLRAPNFHYLFEPGRWLVAEAGILLTTVTAVKQQGSVTYLGTDTGFNHLVRPAMYDAFHDIQNITAVNQEETKVYTVSGNICESGDILGHARTMAVSKTGDLLAVSDAGAYGMSMASEYNRRRLPPEILVRVDGSEKVIRPRKTVDESVKDYLRITGF